MAAAVTGGTPRRADERRRAGRGTRAGSRPAARRRRPPSGGRRGGGRAPGPRGRGGRRPGRPGARRRKPKTTAARPRRGRRGRPRDRSGRRRAVHSGVAARRVRVPGRPALAVIGSTGGSSSCPRIRSPPGVQLVQAALVLALLFVLPGLAWGPVLAPGSGSPIVTAGRAAAASLLVAAVDLHRAGRPRRAHADRDRRRPGGAHRPPVPAARAGAGRCAVAPRRREPRSPRPARRGRRARRGGGRRRAGARGPPVAGRGRRRAPPLQLDGLVLREPGPRDRAAGQASRPSCRSGGRCGRSRPTTSP